MTKAGTVVGGSVIFTLLIIRNLLLANRWEGDTSSNNFEANCIGLRGTTELPGPSLLDKIDGTNRRSNGVDDRIQWKIPSDLEVARNNGCDGNTKALPNGAFCIGNVRYAGADMGLVQGLVDIFQGGTVVDLGAGMGWYKDALLGHPTKPVAGYEAFDGALNVEEKSQGEVKYMDLSQPDALDDRSCSNTADWVMSLEVGEHIPKDREDAFLRNVRCRARLGAIISWATPVQTGGVNHVNLKKREDAIATVERWGFKADLEASEKFKDLAQFGWFKFGNVIVYRL